MPLPHKPARSRRRNFTCIRFCFLLRFAFDPFAGFPGEFSRSISDSIPFACAIIEEIALFDLREVGGLHCLSASLVSS